MFVAMSLHKRAFAFSCLLAMFLARGTTASAQELSVAVSLDGTSYSGDAYSTTDGDRAGEVAVGYETARGIRLSGGVFVGKFDEPVSDPSFTAFSIFFEPSWILRRTARVRPLIGARVAWEHQRAGDHSDGLWAYGWGASAVGGLLVRLGEPVSVGLRTVLSGLNMEREDGTSRNGLRFQIGGTFILTWPLR
jgi:hypothetical protein